MTVLRPLGSSDVALNPFGLLSKMYRFVSGFMRVPPTFTESVGATLKPIEVTTSPLTCTAPVSMSTSASRRVQTPERAKYRFNRIGPFTDGKFAAGLRDRSTGFLPLLGFDFLPVGLRFADGLLPSRPRPPALGDCFM
jgi:hypothetical protein